MIASSRGLKLAALVAALGLHAAGISVLFEKETALVEGSGVQASQLGNSFADMVAGTVTAEETQEVIEPETQLDEVETPVPEEMETVAPEPVIRAEPEVMPSIAPTSVQPIDPVQASAAEVVTVAEALAAAETVDQSVLDVQAADSPIPITAEPSVTSSKPEKMPVVSPIASAPVASPPVAAIAAEAVQPQEAVQAIESNDTLPRISKRPVRRDPALEKPVKVTKAQPRPTAKPKASKPKPAPQKAKPKPVNRGNSAANAKTGTTRGTAKKASTRQGSGQAKSKRAGNAAISNYPGLVNRHLARVRKPRLNRKGVVGLSFTISPSGGLAGVSVTRSSGSARLDQAAVTMIRRAAPFPRPPAGAQRRFPVNIDFH